MPEEPVPAKTTGEKKEANGSPARRAGKKRAGKKRAGKKKEASHSAAKRSRGSRSISKRISVVQARGGPAAILAGVAIIAPILVGELTTGDPYLLMPISLIVLLVGLAGLRAAQGGKDAPLGHFAFLTSCLGGGFLAIVLGLRAYNDLVLNTQLENAAELIGTGFYVLVVGLLLFALAMLKAGVLNRWASLLLLVSIPLGAAIDRFSIFQGSVTLDPGMRAGIKLFGVALIWLGYTISVAKPAPTEARPVEPSAPKSSA